MKHLYQLTKPQFINKIYDYEINPGRFVYAGNTPSVVIFSSPKSKFCLEMEPAFEILAKRHKKHYDVYYINTAEEPELGKFFASGSVPVIYLCPITGEPTILKETINIKEIARLADKIFK